MTFRFEPKLNPAIHDQFVQDHLLANLSQLSSWGQVKQEWDKQYVGLYQEDTLVASAQCYIKKLPLGFKVMYITKGPILDYADYDISKEFFKHLTQYIKHQRIVFIRIDPEIVINQANHHEFTPYLNKKHPIISYLNSLGFKHNGFGLGLYDYAQARFVMKLHYSSDWFENLRKDTKKSIQSALNYNVQIEKISKDEFDRFAAIMKMTETRKGIGLRNKDYFMRMKQEFPDDSLILIAKVDLKYTIDKEKIKLEALEKKAKSLDPSSKKLKQIKQQITAAVNEIQLLTKLRAIYGGHVDIGCMFSIGVGKTLDILYSGFDDRYKTFKSPFLLRKYTIDWGFKQGYEVINFGGVPGTLDDGLTMYKSGYNPTVIEYIGEFDYVSKRLVYFLMTTIWPFVKKIMLKKKRASL